jgi:5-methylcytosine-specific restriction endonuclease McrA
MKRGVLKRGNSSLKRGGPIKKRPISQEKAEQKKQTREKDIAFYTGIWNKRPHICGNCGKHLGKEMKSFHFDHLIEKSTHPQFRHEEDNILLVCFDCHGSKTNGFPGERHLQQMNKAFQKFIEGLS